MAEAEEGVEVVVGAAAVGAVVVEAEVEVEVVAEVEARVVGSDRQSYTVRVRGQRQ